VANPNTVPIYPGSVAASTVKVAVANTARDGSGTLQVFTPSVVGGAQRSVVQRVGGVSSAAVGASTAMVARLWRVTAAGVISLIDEVAIVTATTSNTVVGTRFVFNRTNIILEVGEILKVTQSIAEAVDYECEWSSY
jgi:hypothetical protein